MARPRYPRSNGPLPPALPPATRTVGQLVAESMKFYGDRFWAVIPLGLPLAIVDQITIGQETATSIVAFAVAAPVFAASYAYASTMVSTSAPGRRAWLVAVGVGSLVFLPAAFLLPWFSLAAVVWLALFGFAVPAAISEGRGPGAAVRRSIELARGDIVHAIGGLATLVVLYGLTQRLLLQVLHSEADNTVRVSILLADVVLAPLLFVGPALLFVDLAARLGTTRESRAAARRAPQDAPPPAR
jgi:hypothetical protein